MIDNTLHSQRLILYILVWVVCWWFGVGLDTVGRVFWTIWGECWSGWMCTVAEPRHTVELVGPPCVQYPITVVRTGT